MTRTEKYLVAIIVFLCALLSAFVAEHIELVREYQLHPALTLDPNPPCHLIPAPAPATKGARP